MDSLDTDVSSEIICSQFCKEYLNGFLKGSLCRTPTQHPDCSHAAPWLSAVTLFDGVIVAFKQTNEQNDNKQIMNKMLEESDRGRPRSI